MSHPIVSEELALLEQVNAMLASRPEAPAPSELPIVRDLERLREQLVSRRESKDAMSLLDQWNRQSALLAQLRSAREQPVVDPGSPYFAHLRLREDGVTRDLCLGRATFIHGNVRIVDWRNAPISRIYYRYQQGDDFEEELAGRLRSGAVEARRAVRIRSGVLDRIETPEGVFAADRDAPQTWRQLERPRPRLSGGEASALRAYAVDGGTQRRLGTDLDGDRRRADKHLPEITGLIDAAQFELISRPSTGFLVIRGSAGSGKTTVALHRIAYLAYDDASIDSPHTLFIVFSEGLRNYVSYVLPALGVSRAMVVTYGAWAHEQRRRHFPQLPAAHRTDTPSSVQKLKLHPGVSAALARHVAQTPGPRSAEQALDDWASALTRPDLVLECCREAGGTDIRASEARQLTEWCRQRNEALAEWRAGDAGSDAELDPEDDALLLRAWQLRVGPLRERERGPLRYRHVAIDEVQDFAPIEVQVLLDCLDERRSITLAGDTQQHLMESSGFTSWSAFLGQLGVPGRAVETLRVSYRSTHQIMTLALALLGPLREDDAPPQAPRHGPPVELFRFTDRGACVAFLADVLRELTREEPLASVAVLTPSPAASAAYAEGLAHSELHNLHRVERQDFSFAPGVEVTEIEQAKGLEFDYVVLVDVSADRFPDTPAARRLLHVGATRAVHQLWLTCVGTPSALVRDLEV